LTRLLAVVFNRLTGGIRINPPDAAPVCSRLGFLTQRTAPGLRHHCNLALVLVASLLALALLPLIEPGPRAAQVTLTWDPGPEAEVAGYRVYWGTESGAYRSAIDTGTETDATIPDLEEGETYYFAVTAYSADGLESDYSNEVVYYAAQTCTYAISPMSGRFSADGGESTVTVLTQEGCSWAAASGISWIAVLSGSTGIGSGTITYAVAANTGSLARSAGMTVAGRIFTAYQASISAPDSRRRWRASMGQTRSRGHNQGSQ